MKEYGIYIHIPFCARKCAYCSINSYPVDPSDGIIPGYFEALRKEISVAPGGIACSIYFGGGTPSHAGAAHLKDVINEVRGSFSLLKDAEITVEVNPVSADRRFLDGMLAAGANRISIGIQSLTDSALDSLGRIHSAAEALKCFREARSAGFGNINVDLIYGVPGQSMDGAVSDAKGLMELAPEHISTYCLSVEAETPLHKLVKEKVVSELSDELLSDMYYGIKSALEEKYEHYELSNFAKPGFTAKHNEIYWNYGDYLGFGAGAASKDGKCRYSNENLPAKYMELIKESGSAILFKENLTGSTEIKETVFLGLRLLKGIDLAGWKTRFGKDFLFLFDRQVRSLSELGLAEVKDGHFRLTKKGLFVSNEVFVEFM